MSAPHSGHLFNCSHRPVAGVRGSSVIGLPLAPWVRWPGLTVLTMIRAMTTMRVLLAEALGTFYLCFAGIAAILCTAPPISAGGGLVAIALAHGLALSIAVNNFGGISGAHVNPAVTAAMLVTRRIKPGLAVLYVIAQMLGATIAAITCREIFPAEAVNAAMLGIPLPAA